MKLPKMVTVYKGAKRYDSEAPDELVAVDSIKSAADRAEASAKRHEKYDDEQSKALTAKYKADIKDLKAALPAAAAPKTDKGDKGKKADK